MVVLRRIRTHCKFLAFIRLAQRIDTMSSCSCYRTIFAKAHIALLFFVRSFFSSQFISNYDHCTHHTLCACNKKNNEKKNESCDIGTSDLYFVLFVVGRTSVSTIRAQIFGYYFYLSGRRKIIQVASLFCLRCSFDVSGIHHGDGRLWEEWK